MVNWPSSALLVTAAPLRKPNSQRVVKPLVAIHISCVQPCLRTNGLSCKTVFPRRYMHSFSPRPSSRVLLISHACLPWLCEGCLSLLHERQPCPFQAMRDKPFAMKKDSPVFVFSVIVLGRVCLLKTTRNAIIFLSFVLSLGVAREARDVAPVACHMCLVAPVPPHERIRLED